MNRNLNGVYFHINRNNNWQSICFSNLTEEEMDHVMKGRSEEWLRSMCKALGKTIRDIGDQLNIVME